MLRTSRKGKKKRMRTFDYYMQIVLSSSLTHCSIFLDPFYFFLLLFSQLQFWFFFIFIDSSPFHFPPLIQGPTHDSVFLTRIYTPPLIYVFQGLMEIHEKKKKLSNYFHVGIHFRKILSNQMHGHEGKLTIGLRKSKREITP